MTAFGGLRGGGKSWYEEEIKRYQRLVEMAYREVQAGNERMRPYLESYANHRDSLMLERDNCADMTTIRTGTCTSMEGITIVVDEWSRLTKVSQYEDPKKKVYGPPKIGKGGKVKRW